MGQGKGDERTRAELWKASIKPPMYTVAVTPIAVGSCAAYADTGFFSASTFAAFLAGAILIIAWLNCTNDVFDFDTGIDKNKAESIVNLCGGTRRARNKILLIANMLLGCGFGCLAFVSLYPTFDPTALVLIGVAVCFGYAYQGPPFRLGYYGLGEPICFFTWFISVAAAYHSQLRLGPDFRRPVSASADFSSVHLAETLTVLQRRIASPSDYALASTCLLVAIPTTVILFCSHFHQIHDDAAAGKKSPIVRLGTDLASKVLRVAVVAMYAVQLCAMFLGSLPLSAGALSLTSVPKAVELVAFVRKFHAKPAQVRVAKYYAVRLHFHHGVSLALGLYLHRYLGLPR